MFSINPRLLQPLHNFEAAERYFNDRRPDTSKHKYWKDGDAVPLRDWRDTSKRLVHQLDGSFACTFHHTRLVTFYAHGGVTLKAHQSVSSRAFLSCYMPEGVSIFSWRGRTGFAVRTSSGLREILPKDMLMLMPEKSSSTGVWRIANPGDEQVLPVYAVVDRRIKAWVDARYKDFFAWAKVAEAMLPKQYDAQELSSPALTSLLREPTNRSAWHEALKEGSLASVRQHLYDYYGVRQAKVGTVQMRSKPPSSWTYAPIATEVAV